MSNILYTYGTLRPGLTEPVKIKGTMYAVSWFPGVKLGGTDEFLAERVEIKGDWSGVDRYEGYNPEDEANSLYLRVPYADGFIYEFNRDVDPETRVASGDWLEHTQEKRGLNAGSI